MAASQDQIVLTFGRKGAPRGLDLGLDISKVMPLSGMRVVFDVGGNAGQSVKAYLRAFKAAQIYSFEPSRDLFERLSTRFQDEPRVHCENLALSSHDGVVELAHTRDPTMFHVRTEGQVPPPDALTGKTETVTLSTLDAYCDRSQIDKIDFLKIDTEGHDLEVLKGAHQLLSRSAARFIQCECSMNPENKFHRSFEEIKQHLEGYGYRVFGIYEQVKEMDQRVNLRRTNVAYIAPGL